MQTWEGGGDGMAVEIATAVLEEESDLKKHAKLIDAFVRNLGEPS